MDKKNPADGIIINGASQSIGLAGFAKRCESALSQNAFKACAIMLRFTIHITCSVLAVKLPVC